MANDVQLSRGLGTWVYVTDWPQEKERTVNCHVMSCCYLPFDANKAGSNNAKRVVEL